MAERLSRPLQESILTLLAINKDEGRVAAGMLSSKAFDDGPYRDIASRILQYHKKHGRPPGRAHLDDLVDEVVGDEGHKKHKQYLRVLGGILQQADTESLNPKYILSRVEDFSRRQILKGALIEASDLYESAAMKEDLVAQVEGVLHRALKPQTDGMQKGVYLGDSRRALNFLETAKSDFRLNIPEFDARNLGPTRGTILMYMAEKGGGKSWFCCHVGREVVEQNGKVLHITLEMSEDRTLQRYQQMYHSIAKRFDRYKLGRFKLDDDGGIRRIVRTRWRETDRTLEDRDIRSHLRQKMKRWGGRMDRLHIKEFPMRSLTVEKLEAYIDMLELVDGFIPDVLIVDYPDEMDISLKDFRLGLGSVISKLRGLCQRRQICGILPTQTGRSGWSSQDKDVKFVSTQMVAEDASKFRTADMIIIQSRTRLEKELGLARLYVDKNRDDQDGYEVVIRQDIRRGQFFIPGTDRSPGSRIRDTNYFDLLRELKPPEDNEEEENADKE